jgi:hypothetical protein
MLDEQRLSNQHDTGRRQRTELPGSLDDNAIRLAIEEVAKKPGMSVLCPAKLEVGIDPEPMFYFYEPD